MADEGLRHGARIDLAGAEAALRTFGESTMLPRAAYVDPAVFAWEQETIFSSGWVCVGFSSDRTMIECTWAFAPEALDQPGFDPGYAVEFWDLTNRQDWLACESVQRGLASGHARPGPLAPSEDGVYNFVTMVARSYQSDSVWRATRSTAVVG